MATTHNTTHKPAANAAPAAPAKGPAVPATQAQAATPAANAAAKGAATGKRWGACLAALPGATTALASHIKALPLTTVITLQVHGNPKKRGSAITYAKYHNTLAQGNTTTLGQYINALVNHGGATAAYAHVAWDFNHGFITLSVGATTHKQGQAIAAPAATAPQGALPAPAANAA